ncbi:tRNA (adenine(58)-N(1))-methyltransferase catalytic subunit TRMT61A-like [Dendronephthya gigantea]|uniref:tRNA (adenine(58)-N(1))-methyltransferase catalytic subunit TRMT61A-like n=1 Tax=Dendronephthya gigantea TaxID=151771 RepID=UPI00106D355C|nr:tRNA (adenine(58)-N(1))-methyltransferase catalytic subunit TRMT61A-like [Dendronephthya gigantea]
MSFAKYKGLVEDGDTVIVYLGRTKKDALQIKQGSVLNTKFGHFPHNYLIGQKYGKKIYSKSKKGWLYLLHATPELWTTTLPHRTQILYNADISMVLLQLDLKPGSVVVEAGTGSGSMSHSIMRTIAPTGHLYTFEFHEQRANVARDEFVRHGFGDIVTVANKDVLLNGFGLNHVADAVFLDLPSPWDAVKFSKDALKLSGGHLCSFSPCIEQVQQTCTVLEENGFKDIRSMECLQRKHDVRSITLEEPNFGKSEEENDEEVNEPFRKRTRDETEENDGETGAESNETTQNKGYEETKYENSEETTGENFGENLAINNSRRVVSRKCKQTLDILAACPVRQTPGHTGYLTFAVLYP